MVKDGTNRGGARAGSGAKKKSIVEKITEDNPGKRKLSVIEFPDTANLVGQAMPEPNKMLSSIQKDGTTLVVSKIYKSTWQWLNERGCAALVSPQFLGGIKFDKKSNLIVKSKIDQHKYEALTITHVTSWGNLDKYRKYAYDLHYRMQRYGIAGTRPVSFHAAASPLCF